MSNRRLNSNCCCTNNNGLLLPQTQIPVLIVTGQGTTNSSLVLSSTQLINPNYVNFDTSSTQTLYIKQAGVYNINILYTIKSNSNNPTTVTINLNSSTGKSIVNLSAVIPPQAIQTVNWQMDYFSLIDYYFLIATISSSTTVQYTGYMTIKWYNDR